MTCFSYHRSGVPCHGCCCLAQLSRDADLIGLLHRPETSKNPNGNEATLVIAKARDAEKGLVCFNFEGQFQEFTAKTDKPDTGQLPK